MSEIELDKDVYYSSESEEDLIGNIGNENLTNGKKRKAQVSENETSDEDLEESAQNIKSKFGRKISRRSSNEQLLEERMDLNRVEKKVEQSGNIRK
ncbi:hypothetical protein NQ314_019467 [Rhamnusium bicolor]|uniref:Uncharacterized protein n=1 Tax=Rhamnusium bicolor TaxID=1586634 RepID=A0AAV8WQJ6_9CUCU|nr:hypothetical protein NQ314_019467 [Rhamnusium bicolor]